MCIRKRDLDTVRNGNFELPEGVVIRYFHQKKNHDGMSIDPASQNGSK